MVENVKSKNQEIRMDLLQKKCVRIKSRNIELTDLQRIIAYNIKQKQLWVYLIEVLRKQCIDEWEKAMNLKMSKGVASL